jgi:hypothetical protein
VGGACGSNRAEEKRVMTLVGNPEEKRSLVRTRHTCVDIINMDLIEMGWVM